ncbi:hypothetical protein [Flavobacterium sp. XGLA_31]|uniref:hypothetical protein n=1 Tax=Flavobacterium sp. XGLA_31 TaxID=3447666 RepID=UPI003F2DFF9E
MKQKQVILLFLYHLIFIVFAYDFRVLKGISDAHLYWAQNFDIHKYVWLDFANYGTDFILFLNYPLLKLGLPFWSGFLIYGLIGFFGVLKWMQWAVLVLGSSTIYKKVNLVYLLAWLPNLHFWTANLGKEALVFYGLAGIFYAMASHHYKTFSFITGCLLVLIIRPHVALMLLTAVALVVAFQKNQSMKKKIIMVFVSISGMLVLFYMVLQLTKIRYFDWSRIQRYNDFSVYSFRHSGSYIPMQEYDYFSRIFAFNFRPLFFDVKSILGVLASVENALVLFVCLLGLFFSIRYLNKIHYSNWMKVAFGFALISSLLYVQRYANLGIFMRTKMMFQPFMMVALFCIISQGLVLYNSKK